MAAECHDRQRRGVVAREHPEVGAAELDDAQPLVDRARGFLDADDVLHLGETRDGLGRHVHARAARDVVEDERQVGAASAIALVVLDVAVLGRLVVVGADQQRAVGAGVGGELRQTAGLARVVRARARDDLDAARGFLDRDT